MVNPAVFRFLPGRWHGESVLFAIPLTFSFRFSIYNKLLFLASRPDALQGVELWLHNCFYRWLKMELSRPNAVVDTRLRPIHHTCCGFFFDEQYPGLS